MLEKAESKRKVVYAFIDAANLFYGGEKILGWKVDYKKLLKYLKDKFGVSKAYYYAGVDVGEYRNRTGGINLNSVISNFHKRYINKRTKDLERSEIYKYIQRIKFYQKLDEFGYNLRLKPTKVFRNEGRKRKKVLVLARGNRTAKEIRQLAGDKFMDFTYIEKFVKFKQK